MTTDPDAAGKFYSTVFGWVPHPVEMGGGMTYTLFHRPGTQARQMASPSARAA